MRMIVLAAAVVALSLTGTDARADGPWCARYTNGGGNNCGFYSYEQCQATVTGIGGYCAHNLNYPTPDSRRRN
jgi:Protein of unknown function (DUF3551)